MAAQVEVTHKRDQSKRRERLFYTGMAVAFVLTVFAGFARTFYLRPHFQTQSLIPLLVLHGIVFTSWIALLLTQTTLVATKRTRTHMRLGVAGGLLASLMILIGTVTAIVRAKGPAPVPGVGCARRRRAAPARSPRSASAAGELGRGRNVFSQPRGAAGFRKPALRRIDAP